MKLVEIKDVRPGQIRKVIAFNQWKDEKEFEVLAVIEASGLGEYAEFDTYAEFYDIKTKQLIEDDSEELRFYENGELIGKLGITHRIEDGKLVEIPREDLVVDDIVEYLDFDGFKVTAVIASLITGMTREDSQYGFITNDGNFDESSLFEKEEIGEDSGTFTYTPKKIGILGVTHEFVNDREA